MSSSPFLRARTRAFFIFICVAVLGLLSLSATRQYARNAAWHYASTAAQLVSPDKIAITPAGNTLTVNSLSDATNSADGFCTLREAITAANNDIASGGAAGECAAGSGSDVINIAITGTIDLTSALPNISSDMTINGPGSSQLTVRRSNASFYRIFNVASGTVGLSGLTARDGRTPDVSGSDPSGSVGGGIKNAGTLTMNDVIITSNQSGTASSLFQAADGGGIFNQGTLTMTSCSVTGNTTADGPQPGKGGGIANTGTLTMTNCVVNGNATGTTTVNFSLHGGGIYSTGQMTLTGTTISNNVTGIGGNRSGDGAGIYHQQFSSTGTLVNCTVSGNTTGTGAGVVNRGAGGGILTGANMVITGSTISGNTDAPGIGGAIMNRSLLVMTNSTISGNHSVAGINDPDAVSRAILTNCTITANDSIGVKSDGNQPSLLRNTIVYNNPSGDLSGNYSSRGFNLIGNGGNGAFINGVNGDQVGVNPQLAPLTNNGGPTQTHALLSNSPALDKGDNCVADVGHCADGNITQLVTDQRGFNRLVDGPDADTTDTVDIGAFEAQVSVENIPDKSMNQNSQLQFDFNVGGAASITGVNASSSNTTLVPNAPANIAVSGSGTTRTLTINPAANQSGTSTITVTVNGNNSQSMTDTFVLIVTGPNSPPTFTKGANQIVNEDASAQTVANWATNISPGPSNESGQTVSFLVTNDNNALFSSQPAVSSTGTLTYTPAANANGSATVTVTAKDDGGTANGGVDTSPSQTFTITVNAVNDAPSFTKGADQTVNEDASPQTVTNWATSLSSGPANESGQTLSFQITNNTNAGLFSAGPAVSSTGTLTYTPVANANGSATITINLKDSGGTANGGVDTSASQTFTITVNAVNDAPSFTKGVDQTVNEDAGARTVTNWATSILAGPADESGQTLTFQVTGNTNPGLFSATPAISSTGTLTYTPAANANGAATITINLKDNGGTANGGVDTSTSQTFTITVNAVNDAPSFTAGPSQTVNNNAGLQTIPNWATNISAGPADESSQTLTFSIISNTIPTLFKSGPTVSSNGTLSFQPAPDQGGTATILVQLQDNGGTANGGNDKSTAAFNITVVPVGGFVIITSDSNPTESSGFTTVTIGRSTGLSQPITVDYATSGDNGLPCSTRTGDATPKCDFTAALGTLSFAAGESSKTVTILISQDSFVEGPEIFRVTLSNPTGGAALANPQMASIRIDDDTTEPPTNPVDDARNFVRQHYHDFLNREPDQSGLDFWTNQITSCGSDAACTEVRRINVSAAFFLSIEFQQTGYLVERIYKTAYGDASGTSTLGGSHQLAVPVVRFNEFLQDTQRIGRGVVVLAPQWEQALENNKQAYALEFVQTSRFTAANAFPTTMTPAQFVDKLNQNAGNVLSPSERTTAINLFSGAADSSNTTARAQALRQVAEDQDLLNAEFSRAFVLTEFFGYLRRNPNDPQDTDYTGYDFWLSKLNQFNGNHIAAEMVKAFISSDEYRQRFGP